VNQRLISENDVNQRLMSENDVNCVRSMLYSIIPRYKYTNIMVNINIL